MPYPSKALQEYVLKSELAALLAALGFIAGGGGGGAGPPGPQGPPGPTGPQGPPGPISAPVQSATAPATATGGTITTAGLTVSRVAPSVAITGVVLAVGTIAGQPIDVLNESSNTITFGASGNVAGGTAVIIPGLAFVSFRWDSVTLLWYPNAGAGTASGGGASTYGGTTGTVIATGYTFIGPSGGVVSVASTDFTVQLSPAGGQTSSAVTVTPATTGGGTFNPTSVTLAANTPNANAAFKYTPSSTGAKTITVSNSAGLPNPGSLTYTVTSGIVTATGYTFTGPSSGTVNSPSSNFTVQLSPTGGQVASVVTVTPATTGGGVFSPPTVTFAANTPDASATFTYTPNTTGVKSLVVSNNGGLNNPGTLTYTSNAGSSTTAIFDSAIFGTSTFG